MVRISPNSRIRRVLAVGRDVSQLSSGANLLTQAGYTTDLVVTVDQALRHRWPLSPRNRQFHLHVRRADCDPFPLNAGETLASYPPSGARARCTGCLSGIRSHPP